MERLGNDSSGARYILPILLLLLLNRAKRSQREKGTEKDEREAYQERVSSGSERRSFEDLPCRLYRSDYSDSLAAPVNHSDLSARYAPEKARGRDRRRTHARGKPAESKGGRGPGGWNGGATPRRRQTQPACSAPAELPRRCPKRAAVVLRGTQWFSTEPPRVRTRRGSIIWGVCYRRACGRSHGVPGGV